LLTVRADDKAAAKQLFGRGLTEYNLDHFEALAAFAFERLCASPSVAPRWSGA
jgi:hypothetical protein